MKDKPLTDIKDLDIRNHLQHIHENAMDNDIISVSAEPTTDTLRPKDAPVIYDDKYWFNSGGTIYYIAITEA